MKVPIAAKLGALTVATTAFYAVVGQLVPQKEVHPPKETALRKEMTEAELIQAGQQIMDGKGLCFTCHTVGQSGALRFPDLQGIGATAATRVAGLSDVQYLAQSMYEPEKYIVAGFNPGMPVINKPPIGLTDQETIAVIAWLQSQGGKVSVNLQSTVWPLDAAAAASAAGPSPPGVPAEGAAPTVTPAPTKPPS